MRRARRGEQGLAHPRAATDYRDRLAPTLSYCVVNTNGREFLLACLDAIERTHPAGVEREVLVLDNASERRLGRGGAGAAAATSG